MKSVQSILHIVDAINEWVGKVGSCFIVVLIAIITLEVTLRYVFEMPTIWVHESSELLLVIIAMLGGGYTLLHKGHVSVDILYSRLSVKGQAYLDLFLTAPFMLILYYVLVWKGGQFAWQAIMDMESTGTFWNPPLYPIKMFIPLGGLLITIQGLAKIVRDFITVIGGGTSS